jgi:hypothetical protein
MADHRPIVDAYLKKEFPGASLMDGHDTEHEAHWWSIKQNDKVMVIRVSMEFLTYQTTEQEANALLNNFNPARALRSSAGRLVVLSRDGVRYIPERPA